MLLTETHTIILKTVACKCTFEDKINQKGYCKIYFSFLFLFCFDSKIISPVLHFNIFLSCKPWRAEQKPQPNITGEKAVSSHLGKIPDKARNCLFFWSTRGHIKTSAEGLHVLLRLGNFDSTCDLSNQNQIQDFCSLNSHLINGHAHSHLNKTMSLYCVLGDIQGLKNTCIPPGQVDSLFVIFAVTS